MLSPATETATIKHVFGTDEMRTAGNSRPYTSIFYPTMRKLRYTATVRSEKCNKMGDGYIYSRLSV